MDSQLGNIIAGSTPPNPPIKGPIKGEGLYHHSYLVLPPPRWGRVGVGVMRAECVDSVENRSNGLSRCYKPCGAGA